MLSISKKTFNTPGVYKISINNKCYYTFIGNIIKCPFYKKL